MRWLGFFFSGVVGAALALGACGDDSGSHGVASDAGVGGLGGSGGGGGVVRTGDAGVCPEVTPESVGCKARYEDQLQESALTYGACGSYQAWLALGPPAVVCIYDMTGDLVYWRSCGDAAVACGTGSGNACHANGLNAPNGPACFLPAPMRPGTGNGNGNGNGANSDAGLHDAGGNGDGATLDDAGPTDAG